MSKERALWFVLLDGGKGCGSCECQSASLVRSDGVAEGVVSVVAAETLFVYIHFEHVFGVFGVVPQAGQAFDEAAAAVEDEEGRGDADVDVAKAVAELVCALDVVAEAGGGMEIELFGLGEVAGGYKVFELLG